MARHFEFPVPEDRSINKPHTTLESREILGLYNQRHDADAKRIGDSVKNWLEQEAKSLGWETVTVSEGVAILGVNSLRYGDE